MKKLFAILSLFVAGWASADSGHIVVDTNLPIPQPLAYNSTFTVRTDGINWAASETVLTSATVSAATFKDGSSSTGSLTVVSYAALSSATATGTSIKISSDTALVGACLSGGALGVGLGNFNVCNPQNFAVDLVYSTNTACNIAAAIAAQGPILSTCTMTGSTGIIYSTAPTYGSVWNNFAINSSTLTAISSSTFSGGQDNQSFTVNGKVFLANRDFYPVTSNNQTATNIATAITNSSTTTGVAGAAANAVVTTTATTVGTATNYALASSSNAALSLSAPVTIVGSAGSTTMTGGTNSAYTITTPTITVVNNGLGLAQGVVYSTGTGVTVSPLVWGTTYYVIPIAPTSAGTFALATTPANALAGTFITLTSSQTNATADLFTLTPQAISGTPKVTWVVSNDNLNWVPYTTTSFNVTVPAITYGTYYSTGSVSIQDFGHMNYGYLGLSVSGLTTGAVNLSSRVVGNAP